MTLRFNIWFPFFVGDYLAETQRLTYEGKGVYVGLLCAYCHSQTPLPDDDEQLARLTGLPIQKWRKLRNDIAPIFTIAHGVWTLPRLDEQIERGIAISKKRAEAGRKGGKRSAAIRQANAQANASPESRQMLKHSHSQLHNLPLTVPQGKGVESGSGGETLAEFVKRDQVDE